jgi:hypothetical protein
VSPLSGSRAAPGGSIDALKPDDEHPLNPESPADVPRERDTHPASPVSRDLARELTGDLPCISCGYNLRSISVLGVCPECATPVRATILARVDPYAGILRPIGHPRIIATGLLLWSVGALVAALLTWGFRIADALEVLTNTPASTGRLIQAAMVALALSAAGAALSLVAPHRGIPRRQIVLALAALFAYIPLMVLYWQLHAVYDPPRVRPYLETMSPDLTRAMLRLAAAAALLIIVLGLRPNLRLLTARSLVLRMGRVDRQTMMGLAAAILVYAAGDLLHMLAMHLPLTAGNTAFVIGILLIAVGSMLLTVGIVGILIDCTRIVPVVLRPPISRQQVLGEDEEP